MPTISISGFISMLPDRMPPFRIPPGLPSGRILHLLAALVLAVSALSGPALASGGADDIFTVRGVPVDVTAGNASIARDRAMAEAQATGFRLLFDRLTPDSLDQPRPNLPASQLEPMVEAVEVEEERTSAVRYLGRFTVRFRHASVRSWFQSNAIRYAELQAKPLLVLAVDETGPQPVLWESETAWRQAWASLPAGGLIPVLSPLGELQDINGISVGDVLTGDAAALDRMAHRYEAGGILVARLTGTAPGTQVTAGIHRTGQPVQSLTVAVPASGSQAPDSQARDSKVDDPVRGALAAAAARLVRMMEEEWAAAHLLDTTSQAQLTAVAQFDDLAGWVQIRMRLGRVPAVARNRVLSVSRRSAELDLIHLGTVAQLQTALAQQDLQLVERPGLPAILQLAAASQPSAPQPSVSPPAASVPPAETPLPASPR
jgi:hypothetical protein